MGYVNNILMELDHYDLRQKDEWNPLYDPKKEKKPSYGIELDTDRVGFGNDSWFDKKNPSPVFIPDKIKVAVANIHQDLMDAGFGVQTAVKFLHRVVDASNDNVIGSPEILDYITKISPTISSIYRDFRKTWPKDLNNMEFKFLFEDLIKKVLSRMSSIK